MKIRRAQQYDLETIVELRHERAAWLAAHGSDQWSAAGLDDTSFRRRVHDSIQAGETWMIDDDRGRVLGTVAVDQHCDPALWSADECADAVIVHRMIARADAGGRGVGRALLEQADSVAQQQGRNWVRLDAWTTNTALHQLYKRHGFRHVRTLEDAPTPSAALFERRVVRRHVSP